MFAITYHSNLRLLTALISSFSAASTSEIVLTEPTIKLPATRSRLAADLEGSVRDKESDKSSPRICAGARSAGDASSPARAEVVALLLASRAVFAELANAITASLVLSTDLPSE
jgi:hypothetical protein